MCLLKLKHYLCFFHTVYAGLITLLTLKNIGLDHEFSFHQILEKTN